MKTTWIVAADSSRARVLQVAGREHLLEVESLANPEGRLQNREINTDAKGRFAGLDELPKDLSWFNVRELEKHLVRDSERAP